MVFSCKFWGVIKLAVGITILPAFVAKADSTSNPSALATAAYLSENQLSDRQLAAVRGGLSTTAGVVINFSFQEATYVNYNLVQNVVLPTLTITSGGSATGGVNVNTSSLVAASNAINQLANVPSTINTVIGNSTTVTSTVGNAGINDIVSNTANAQVVQQFVNANIGITGFSSSLQSALSATVLNHATTNPAFH
jgi:hypothetical protein